MSALRYEGFGGDVGGREVFELCGEGGEVVDVVESDYELEVGAADGVEFEGRGVGGGVGEGRCSGGHKG